MTSSLTAEIVTQNLPNAKHRPPLQISVVSPVVGFVFNNSCGNHSNLAFPPPAFHIRLSCHFPLELMWYYVSYRMLAGLYQGPHPHKTPQTQKKGGQISMPRVVSNPRSQCVSVRRQFMPVLIPEVNFRFR